MLKISVIMGVHNFAAILNEALSYIENQTETNWKFILCDDGSSDNTFVLANEFKNIYPDKVVLLQNDKNRGLNYKLNKCLHHANGICIARMDGYGRCSNLRFERKLQNLENSIGIAIASTDMTSFDEFGTLG